MLPPRGGRDLGRTACGRGEGPTHFAMKRLSDRRPWSPFSLVITGLPYLDVEAEFAVLEQGHCKKRD